VARRVEVKPATGSFYELFRLGECHPLNSLVFVR